jgi:hypothetical protein
MESAASSSASASWRGCRGGELDVALVRVEVERDAALDAAVTVLRALDSYAHLADVMARPGEHAADVLWVAAAADVVPVAGDRASRNGGTAMWQTSRFANRDAEPPDQLGTYWARRASDCGMTCSELR